MNSRKEYSDDPDKKPLFVQQSNSASPLNIETQSGLDGLVSRSYYYLMFKKFKSLIIPSTLIVTLLILDYYYALQLRVCEATTQQSCFSFFFLDDITTLGALYRMAILSLIFGSIMFLTLSSIINRQLFYVVFINYIVIIVYYHKEASYLDFSFIYSYLLVNFTIMVLVTLFVIFGLFKLGKVFKKRKLTKQYSLLLLVGIMIFVYRVNQNLKPNKFWTEGVMGKKLQDKTEDGQQYCKISTPKYDWRNYWDGKVDIAYHYIDCTKKDFNEYEANQAILRKYIPNYTNQRYIAFPLLNELPNPYSRQETQEYIFSQAVIYTDLNDIPKDIEYVLNTETMTYQYIKNYIMNRIQVQRNAKLIEERAKKHTEFKKKLNEQTKTRLPFKNMIVIYIDALSRIAFPKKMPKFFQWFEDYQTRNKPATTLFQGMRAHSIATFTYHNILAYNYGVRGITGNVHKNSPFSLTNGTTNVVISEEINPKTGKKEITKTIGDGLVYDSFTNDLKEAGYITGITSTDCALTPLSQEDVNIKGFLNPINYDHTGITQSCDPNYFLPSYRTSSGGGPYSVYRRCLYGVELIDYTTNYAKEFLTKYSDQPKFLSMEYLEAHERNQEVITYQDQKIYNFLNWMEQNGHVLINYNFKLDDSIFLLVSDHGMHMTNIIEADFLSSKILNPDNGFPIQIMLINNKFLEKEDQLNLIKNEQKLTTMFEIFYFIKYLTSSDNQTEFYRNNSLVSGMIPSNRSSFDLPDIEDNPMICLNQRKSKK